MQKRILKVLLAFMLIMSMTLSNFLLIGISTVNAVEEIVQEKNTNNKNVEFMAYFKDEQGNKVSTYSSKTTDTDLKLYLSVSVKQEGYFNGAITLKNSNFKFKTDLKNDKISDITENSVILNQINAGDSVELEIKAETIKETSYEVSLVKKESTLELTGTYRDSKQKDISVKGTRKLTLTMASPYSKENNGIFLNQTILTNKVLNYDGEHRVVQLQVETGLKDNMYPVKNAILELQAPKIGESYPEKMYIQTPEELATNGAKISDNDEEKIKYSYDNKTGKVQVTTQNPEKDGKVVWNQTGKDRYVITYVFASTEKVENQKISANAEISLYDQEKTKMSYNSEITITSEDVDSVINVSVKNQEDEMYKGKLYAGIDREFTEKMQLQVNLENIAEKINMQEDFSSMGLSNVYTKNIVVNKSNLLDILGQEGTLKILDKNTKSSFAELNANTQPDNEQNIIISLPDKTAEIAIETTKPVKTGTLEISTTKIIGANSKEKVKETSEINYLVHSSYDIGDVENKMADATAKIALKESYTNATINVSKNEFSTMRTNENVEIRVTLNSNSEEDELYKNPHILVNLPEEFETIDVTSIKLLNEEELKIKSAKLINKTIDIQLEGVQTEYKGKAIEGATILMNMNLVTNKKQKNADKQISVTYTNENVVNYKNGETTGSVAQDIKIVSYAGVITTNSIKEYGIETINNEGNQEEKLALGVESKTATVTSEIINNNETSISNVKILGTLPTKGALTENTVETIVEGLQITGIDNSKIKVYYSENANATADTTNSSNAWQEKITNNKNVKKYLITVTELSVSEDMNISYKMTIPEKLEYNETLAENYVVYYTDTTGVEQNMQVSKMTLTTGKGPTVETSLKATVGGKETDTVKEGEKIQYKLTAKNTGSEKVENLTLVGLVPEGTIYTEEVTPSTEMEGDKRDQQFNEVEDKKEVKYEGITLQPGEEISKIYMVKVKTGTAEQKTITNKIEAQYGEAKKESNTVTTNVAKGQIEVSLVAAEAAETVKPGYQYRYIVSVKNISNKDIKNIKLQFDVQNFTIKQILATKDDELQSFDSSNTYTIDKLAAWETSEISLYVEANMFTDTKTKTATINVSAKVDKVEYYANSKELTSIAQIVDITNESDNAGQYVKAGDTIVYKINVTNNGQDTISSVSFEDKLSSYESLKSIVTDGKELSEDDYEQEENFEGDGVNFNIKDELAAGQTKTYVVTSVVDADADNSQAVELGNTATAYAYDVETGKSEVMHVLEPTTTAKVDGDIEEPTNDADDSEDNNNTNNDNNNSNNANNSNGNNNSNNSNNGDNSSNNQSEEKQNLKIISGLAWLDKDENGQKDDGETLLQGIKVKLFNTETNKYQTNAKNEEITATTDDKGFYTLADVPQGKYMVVFEYDTSKFTLTAYEKEGTSSEKNSKVISKEMTIDGVQKEVGVTEEITVKENHISHINLGLKERKVYDMKLEKMISRVVVQNSKTTRAVEYNDSTLAKVDLDSKQLSNTSVVVEYKIRVTNEGEVAGYIKKIQDYVSSDFKFSSELNKDWYQSGTNLYNSSLANVKLEPGQSKEITLILTKQMTENNTGLVNNTAEIVESYNEQGLKDSDSTEGNRAKGEDDMGSADLILSIKTGQVVATVLVILSTIVIIGVAAYIIAKRALNKRVI